MEGQTDRMVQTERGRERPGGGGWRGGGGGRQTDRQGQNDKAQVIE